VPKQPPGLRRNVQSFIRPTIVDVVREEMKQKLRSQMKYIKEEEPDQNTLQFTRQFNA